MTPDFDFDTPIDRHNTNSYKWDSAADARVLPMWVADMDFTTAPAVRQALEERVAHGIFGYTLVPDEYYLATIDWFRERHGWSINRDTIIYTSGVVPAISAIIKALTRPGDKVIVQTPVYNCFFSSIRNNGCEISENRLICRDRYYTIDFDDLEVKASDPTAKILLLCNPHNPVGRVWKADELQRVAEICKRHGVRVVSDEIHCELTFPGIDYTPFGSIDPEAIVCCSPSKAFNRAGLQIANIIVPDADERAAVDKAININEVCDVNPFGVVALIAAYRNGAAWLDSLREYIHANYESLCLFFAERLPMLKVTRMEGTYLVWVDCRALGINSAEFEDELLEAEHLWLNAGTMYGTDGYMRINIACPRTVMKEGLERLARFVDERFK